MKNKMKNFVLEEKFPLWAGMTGAVAAAVVAFVAAWMALCIIAGGSFYDCWWWLVAIMAVGECAGAYFAIKFSWKLQERYEEEA